MTSLWCWESHLSVYFDYVLRFMWTCVIRSLIWNLCNQLIFIRKLSHSKWTATSYSFHIDWFVCLVFAPSMLEYVVNLNQDLGVVSVPTVQIPFSPQGNPFNHCFMVTIAVLIASEGLPWAEQMVAYSFFSVLLPLRDEEGGYAQSHPAWKNRPLPQKDKGPFWPH